MMARAIPSQYHRGFQVGALLVTLPDYPSSAKIRWDTGLPPEMLRVLGNLAVASAHVEELLHQVYWHHAKLDERTGPIVTDNLNPKRLEEDIIKIVSLDTSRSAVLADLKIIFEEFRQLNTKRNHCLHWIWEAAAIAPTDIGAVIGAVSDPAYQLKRPIYRQTGLQTQSFSINEIQECCDGFSWLAYRLRSHTFSDEDLRQKRREAAGTGTLLGGVNLSFADLFWPAPWLDKRLPPDSTPANPPETQK
jgi:hypothetical protein